MISSNCNYGFSNIGVGCMPLFSVAQKLFFVPTFDSTGVRNKIDTTVTFNQAYLDSMVGHADPSKRWYPSPFMKNATNMRGESIKESFDDGTSIITQQAPRKFSAKIIAEDASPQLLGILKSARPVAMSIFVIDKDWNMHVTRGLSVLTDAYPIRIDNNSVDPVFNPGEDKTTQKIDLMFDIHVSERDENLQMISYDEMGGADIINAVGLKDVSPIYSLINTAAAATMTVQLNTIAGTIKTPVTVKGLVAADFVGNIGTPSRAYDVTSAVDKTITSVTERVDGNGKPAGIYDIVFSANITAADKVRFKIVKAGFDFGLVYVNPFTSA